MMMMGTSSSSSSNQSGNVFTAAQWEELEQQALIYKYMVSGVPVPSQLILSLRRSLLYNPSSSSSSSSSLLLSVSNQTTLVGGGVWEGGSSCYPYNNQFLYQIGGGGRKIDLEPGRCRRTDGKKWRCSKEAYPDSKYCERHMHRGRNRSRKPVEFSSSSSSSSSSSATTPVNVSSSPSAAAPISLHTTNNAYPPFSSTFMDNSSTYSHHSLKHYRQLEGMKDLGGDQDDRSAAYFQLNDPYTTTTQKMSSDHHHHHHHNYSHFSFQNLKDDQKKQEKQHCFVMGTDFIKPSEQTTKSNNTKPDETTTKQQQQQPFHHFFSPPKATLLNPNHDPNWAGQVDHNPKATLSTQDLFQSKPRPYW